METLYVNYLTVVGAAIANVGLGFLWYGPLFGRPRLVMLGVTQEIAKAQQVIVNKRTIYALLFFISLVSAYILQHFVVFADWYLNISGVWAGVITGFWSWLGFVAPVTIGPVLIKEKPWKLWILHNGYYLASLLMMGIILAKWA